MTRVNAHDAANWRARRPFGRLCRGPLAVTVSTIAMALAVAPAASAVSISPSGMTTNPLAFAGDQTIYSTPDNTLLQHIAVADLNGDGLPDVVGLDAADGDLVVVPNPSGPSSFAATYSVGNSPDALAVADLGNAGPDIVTLSGGNTISVFLNNGDGTFDTTPTTYEVGSGTNLAIADVNGDGHPDIVVGDGSDYDDAQVLYGNGTGSFTENGTDYPLGQAFDSMVVGDFTGNGLPDIATTNYENGTVSVIYNNGNGTFSAPYTFPAGDHPAGLAVGDFNGDGYPDLAVVDYPTAVTSGTDAIDVLLNNGTASTGPGDQFAAPSLVANLPNQNPEGTPTVQVGDLRGDGIPDIAVSDGNQIDVYPGNGDGTFGAGVTVGSDPLTDFAIADMNGDGAPDFVLGTITSPGAIAMDLHVIPPTNSVAPTLSKNALVNEELTGDTGQWNSLVTPQYSWVLQRCDQNGQNCSNDPNGESGEGPIFVDPTPDDAGSTLRVAVTATNTAGYSAPAYSNVTNVVPPPPGNIDTPVITGQVSAGNAIKMSGDTWNMSVTRSYSWWSCPAGDTDPSAFQSQCYPLAFTRGITVPTQPRLAGTEIQGVVTATNPKHGTSYAPTPLATIVAITPTSKALPDAAFNRSYRTVLKALGGTAPWTWSVSSGSLPNGLSLGTSSGVISGEPTATGTYTFTVQASDSSSPALVATRTYSLTVDLAIAPQSLPNVKAGHAYSVTLKASGGTAPYTWGLASGSSLPDGLSLGSSTGTISGNPTTTGTYTFTVQASDASSPALTASRTYTLNVLAG